VMNELAGKAEGTFEVTDGGRPSAGANLALNIPLVTDKLAARIVGYYRHDGGWVDNVATGRNNVNKQDSYSVRGLLRFEPSPDVSFTANVSYQRDKPKDSAYVTYGDQGFTYAGATPQFVTNKSFVANLVGEADLGIARLTSSTTFADRTNDSVRDFTPVITAVYGLTAPSPVLDAINTKGFAQEIRLASNSTGPFQWLVGGFYLRNKQHIDENITTPGFGAAFGYPTDQSLFGFYDVKSIEKALFGELSYNLTEKLKATAGVRLVWNDVSLFSEADGDLNGGPSTLDRRSKDDAFTPKFALSYQADPNIMLYVQAAKGYRVGQNNLTPLLDPTSSLPIPPDYKSDSLWNYEGGIKSTLAGGRVTANAAVYYIDWKDIQLKTVSATGFSYVGNAGTAKSYGLELEVRARLSKAFELGTAASINRNRLKSVIPGAAATVGDRLPGTPRFSITNFAQYTAEFGGGNSVYLRLAHQYSGMAYSDFRNATALQFGDYNRFDARLGWQSERFELVAFIDNITNRDEFTNAVRLSNGPAAIRMRPRTFGFTARTEF
jgi:outer membrane receptor protein involved in Fe transport